MTTRRRILIALAVIVLAGSGVAGRYWLAGAIAATGETVTVTRGEYSDIVEIRGQVQPVRSTYVTAPYNAGELQILKIASNGTAVKTGDTVAEFDALTLRRTIQEKQVELKSATAELAQGAAQSAITVEERRSAVKRAEFDVTKAKLSLGDIGLVSAIESAKEKLALADAEQRLRETEAALASASANAKADRESRQRRVTKVTEELERAKTQASSLSVTAPTDGTVNILQNYRNNPATEYRAGDRAYPGAIILELPDLSSVFLTARIDEADRGQLKLDQTATIRVDAIADRDYQAKVSQVSVLARVDFQSGWPPPKQFDLQLAMTNPDNRLKPGMSAAARIAVGRMPNVLLVPSSAIAYEDGRTVVYRWARNKYEPVAISVIRRGREQAAVSGDIKEGDTISRAKPEAPGSAGRAGQGGQR